MTIPIFVPVTLNDGPNAGLVMVPFVDALPLLPTTSRVLILDTQFGVLDPGMYVFNNLEQTWRLEMPIEAVSLIIVNGDDAAIYLNTLVPVTVANNAAVYRNGVLTTLTTIPIDSTAIYAVRTPKTSGGGGQGTVDSVNGVMPDVFGDVALTAADIPGISTVGKTGQYSDLLGAPAPYDLPIAAPGSLGGIKVGAGLTIDPDGTLNASGASYTLPVATDTILGGVTIGTASKLSIDPSTGALGLDADVLTKINNALTSVVGAAGGPSLVQSTVAGVVTLKALIAGANTTVTDNGTGGLAIASTGGMTTVTLTGDATGVSDGSGNIPVVLAPSGVTAGVYSRVTVDAKGRVTAGVAATTLADLGITADYLPLAGGSMTGDITMTAGKTIKSVPTPLVGGDAVNKDYVDAQIANAANGVSWRESVNAATTTNLAALSAPQTVDGVSLVAGNRVLVKNQTDQTLNGLYVVAAGAWTRATDSDTGAELFHAAVLVLGGTTQGLTQWVNTNIVAPVVGADNITFSQLKAASDVYLAGAGLSLSGFTFSIANTGVTAGTYTAVTVNAQGQVTAGRAILSSEITGALGFTPYNGTTNPLGFISGTQTLTLTGDMTANGTLGSPLATTLAATGVAAGTYTSVTVDTKGRVTAGGTVSNAQIVAALGYTPVNKAGDTMAGALNWAPQVTVASASTTLIGAAASNIVSISGTTPIIGFDAAPGAIRTLIFQSAGLVLTNSASLILPGGANITTQLGDTAIFINTGGTTWRCWSYQRADGTALSGGSGSPFTTLQDFQGSVSNLAARFANVVEKVNMVASNPTTVYANLGSVWLSTVNASANWVYDFRQSSGALLNASMAIGDSITFAIITQQGSSAFFPTAVQVDGVTRTVVWQGGAAPSAGNANGRDVYTFTIIKTAAVSFTVLGAQTQYK